jgi:hypothetical protein
VGQRTPAQKAARSKREKEVRDAKSAARNEAVRKEMEAVGTNWFAKERGELPQEAQNSLQHDTATGELRYSSSLLLLLAMAVMVVVVFVPFDETPPPLTSSGGHRHGAEFGRS